MQDMVLDLSSGQREITFYWRRRMPMPFDRAEGYWGMAVESVNLEQRWATSTTVDEAGIPNRESREGRI